MIIFRDMKFSVFVDSYKYYYTADKIELVDVSWSKDEVIKLVDAKECYDENLYEDPDTCGVGGTVFIPKNKINHIIMWD